MEFRERKKGNTKFALKGVIFVGYNIKGFDLPMIKQFLNVDIPESQILDLCLCQPQKIAQLTGKNRSRLEEACKAFGIDASHKQRMDEKAKAYKTNEAFKARSLVRAKELVQDKKWTVFFHTTMHLIKSLVGTQSMMLTWNLPKAVDKNTLFYDYAIGDIISEFSLLKKLGY